MAIKRASPGGPTTGERAHRDDIREATAAIAEVLAPVRTEVTATVERLWQEVTNDRLAAYAIIRYSPAPDCGDLIRGLGDAPQHWLTFDLIRSAYWNASTRAVFDSACTDDAQPLPLIPLSRFLAVTPGATPPSDPLGFGPMRLEILRHTDPTFTDVDVNRLWRRHCRLGFSLADLDILAGASATRAGATDPEVATPRLPREILESGRPLRVGTVELRYAVAVAIFEVAWPRRSTSGLAWREVAERFDAVNGTRNWISEVDEASSLWIFRDDSGNKLSNRQAPAITSRVQHFIADRSSG